MHNITHYNNLLLESFIDLGFWSNEKLKWPYIFYFRFCSIQGDDIISAGQSALETRCCKLHILDVSMNKINRQQQTTIKRLYKTLTDILIVDIPDRPQMEFVAQMWNIWKKKIYTIGFICKHVKNELICLLM